MRRQGPPHPPNPGEPVPSVPPVKARGWDSSARSFPASTSWREKASLSPFQRSLRSLPPTLAETQTIVPLDCSRGQGGLIRQKQSLLCVSGGGPSPLGTPVLCSRKSPNSLRLVLRSSLPPVEKPCPLSPRRTSSPDTLASSRGGLRDGLGAAYSLFHMILWQT